MYSKISSGMRLFSMANEAHAPGTVYIVTSSTLISFNKYLMQPGRFTGWMVIAAMSKTKEPRCVSPKIGPGEQLHIIAYLLKVHPGFAVDVPLVSPLRGRLSLWDWGSHQGITPFPGSLTLSTSPPSIWCLGGYNLPTGPPGPRTMLSCDNVWVPQNLSRQIK